MDLPARSPATPARRSRPLAVATGAVALLAASAWFVRRQTRKAEAENPPQGRMVVVDGVALHVLERGDADAPALVMLHGNGAMAQELVLSGIVGRAASRYRVLAFDRPGYGHSQRPGGHAFDPAAQARLVLGALRRLGVERALVLGHSWGTLVALHMALQAPEQVRALVLVSGYYHPSVRLDVPWMSAPALPVLGTLMRYTVSPLAARLLWPLMNWRIFSPREVTEPFKSQYPVWMSLRPLALRAAAAESAMMIPAAVQLQGRLRDLKPPVVIVAGDADRMVNTRWQSQWLHRQLPGSQLRVVPDAGHMVHHVAAFEVMKAIDQADRIGRAHQPAMPGMERAHDAAAAPAR